MASTLVNKRAAHTSRIPSPTDNFDLTTGVLSITIAPDNTCGFDEIGNPAWTCTSTRLCSWVRGRMNIAFCGWEDLQTTCLDSSVAMNTDLCDEACTANPYIQFCNDTELSICQRADFGNGVYNWACDSRSSQISIWTTLPLETRELRTVVVVDGTPVSRSISSFTTTQPTTTATDPTKEEITSSSHEPSVGAIVGGVLGGLAIISLGVLGILLYRRKRNKATQPESTSTPAPQVDPQLDTPSTNEVMASQISNELPGVTTSSIIKPRGHTVSLHSSDMPHTAYQTTHSPPPIYEVPSAGSVEMHELDNDRTQHHHGSIQEML